MAQAKLQPHLIRNRNPIPALEEKAGRQPGQDAEHRPDELFYVNQRNYHLGPDVPRWKRWFFKNVWMRFARFCYLKLRLPSPDGADKNGDIFWLEHERICFDEWQAEQEAARFEIGGIHRLPVTYSSPPGTECVCMMPNSPASEQYKRNGKATVEVGKLDLVKLAGKIAASDQIVKRYKPAL